MTDRSDRLRQARIAAGFETTVEAADRFHWNRNTYKSNENGASPFSFKKAKEYAKAFGVRAEWLYDEIGPAKDAPQGATEREAPYSQEAPGDPVDLSLLRNFIRAKETIARPATAGRSRVVERKIPVAGDVAAGVWREAVQREWIEADEFLPVDVQGYERAQLRAWKVVGPSMNLVYPEGRYVITAHPAEAGVRHGDYVVVERRKSDLVEVTLKELVRDPDGRIALWPRSSHPDFQTPIYLNWSEDDIDQTAPQIVGVVVADYSKRVRPPAMFSAALLAGLAIVAVAPDRAQAQPSAARAAAVGRLEQVAQFTATAAGCSEFGFTVDTDGVNIRAKKEAVAEWVAAGQPQADGEARFDEAAERHLRLWVADGQRAIAAMKGAANPRLPVVAAFRKLAARCTESAGDRMFGAIVKAPANPGDVERRIVEVSDKLLESGGFASWQTPQIQARGDLMFAAGACRTHLTGAQFDATTKPLLAATDPRASGYYAAQLEKGFKDAEEMDFSQAECAKLIASRRAAAAAKK